MTTLYKNTNRLAATIVATLVLSVGTAVAVTKDNHSAANAVPVNSATQHTETIGRFVVTPNSVKFVAPATENVGRFVVSQNGVVFVPDQANAKA
jgi:hypothetical protein